MYFKKKKRTIYNPVRILANNYLITLVTGWKIYDTNAPMPTLHPWQILVNLSQHSLHLCQILVAGSLDGFSLFAGHTVRLYCSTSS